MDGGREGGRINNSGFVGITLDKARLTFSLTSSRIKWSKVNRVYGVGLLSISCNEMPSRYYVEQMKGRRLL